MSLYYLVFVFGLSLTILPSILGCNSTVAFMFDTHFFNIIGKTTLAAYLIHIIVIRTVSLGTTSTYYLSFYYKLFETIGICTISVFLAFLVTLVV